MICKDCNQQMIIGEMKDRFICFNCCYYMYNQCDGRFFELNVKNFSPYKWVLQPHLYLNLSHLYFKNVGAGARLLKENIENISSNEARNILRECLKFNIIN